MVEKDVDKRNKVYKAVDSVGYICEMKPQTTATLEKWIAGLLTKDNLKISREACDLILDKTGAGMDYIRQEACELLSGKGCCDSRRCRESMRNTDNKSYI